MNKFLSNLPKVVDRLFTKFVGHKCERCGGRNTEYSSYRWTRGWNHYCEQAYGDAGCYCNVCHHVTFDDTLEKHLATLPSWCKPSR